MNIKNRLTIRISIIIKKRINTERVLPLKSITIKRILVFKSILPPERILPLKVNCH